MEMFIHSLYSLIATGKGELPEPPMSVTQNACLADDEYRVWLTVSLGFKQAFVYEGKGNSIRTAALKAVDYYSQHQRLAPFQTIFMRFDLLTGFSPVSVALPLLKPFEGIGLGTGLQVGFLQDELKSHAAVAQGAFDTSRFQQICSRHFSESLSAHLLKSVSEGKLQDSVILNTDAYGMWEEQYRHLSDSGEEYLSAEELHYAVSLAQNHYFKEIVNEKGKMTYVYHPTNNLKEKRYNILRHSGTIYSMLEVMELNHDEELMPAIKKAIAYLINKMHVVNLNGQCCRGVVDKDTLKLGGNALAIIALAKYAQVSGFHDFLPLMQEMAEWIRLMQDEDGRFTVHKQVFSSGEVSDFVSGYYPGEAMLAMVRLYQLDGQEKWLDVAEKSAHYLINVRDKNADEDTIVHDHWLLYALNELYQQRQRPLFLNHASLIADAIIKKQIRDNHEAPEQNGAYRLPLPRLESTPTACRSEGLCAVYHLMKFAGYQDKADRLLSYIDAGIRFQLQTQIRPESAIFFKHPRFCTGAFQRSLFNDELRIDFTQHNLSSIIGYYKILCEKT